MRPQQEFPFCILLLTWGFASPVLSPPEGTMGGTQRGCVGRARRAGGAVGGGQHLSPVWTVLQPYLHGAQSLDGRELFHPETAAPFPLMWMEGSHPMPSRGMQVGLITGSLHVLGVSIPSAHLCVSVNPDTSIYWTSVSALCNPTPI